MTTPRHPHYYRADLSAWWCRLCDTNTDWCAQDDEPSEWSIDAPSDNDVRDMLQRWLTAAENDRVAMDPAHVQDIANHLSRLNY